MKASKRQFGIATCIAAGLLCLTALSAGGDIADHGASATGGGSVWIQVGAHGTGMHGSQWRTDLGLRNTGTGLATVEVRFFPMGGGAMRSQIAYVAAGAQSLLEDVVGQLGGIGNGAMEVLFDQPLVVNSRTYTLIAPGAACTPGGSLGQYYAAHRVEDGLGVGQSAWLGSLVETSRFRSNIALTNMGTSPATVWVELFDGAGGLLNTFDVTVGPARFHQEVRVYFTRAGQSNVQRGSARVTVTSGSGIIASASVVDNVTNDPTTIPALQPFGAGTAANEITVLLPGDVPLTMVRIPAGTFMMGAPEDEWGIDYYDKPQHQVTLTQDYYLGKYEVTQRQWVAVMGSNPAVFTSCGLDCPVEGVSWHDICGRTTGSSCTAPSFIGKLNAHLSATGQPGAGKFRMPTEAEWERGARGGTTGPFSFDTSANPSWDIHCGSFPQAEPYMWWCRNSNSRTHPVGQKLANPFGLYDVHGNVWEWVGDWWGPYISGAKVDPTGPSTGSARVKRGGSWNYTAGRCRSAMHYRESPDNFYNHIGFRLARSL